MSFEIETLPESEEEIYLALDSDEPFPIKSGMGRDPWDAFVNATKQEKPATMSFEEYAQLKPLEKAQSRNRRRRYFNRAGPFFPPSYKSIVDDVRTNAVVALEQFDGVRMGAIITGPPTAGKTTVARHIGRLWQIHRKRAHILQYSSDEQMYGEGPWDFVPVIYVTLRGTSTHKALLRSLAYFLRISDFLALNEGELTLEIVEHINECGTSMIIIDDIHFLDTRFKGRDQLINDLKHIMQSTPSMFVLAGVDCKTTGIFLEWGEKGASAQTSFRFTKHELEPLTPTYLKRHIEEFKGRNVDPLDRLLATLEVHCPLLNAQKGDLLGLKNYLIERTGGLLGAVVHLLRLGVARAVENGTERIDKALLEEVKLSHGAQTIYDRTKSHREAKAA
jgi:AAA domain